MQSLSASLTSGVLKGAALLDRGTVTSHDDRCSRRRIEIAIKIEVDVVKDSRVGECPMLVFCILTEADRAFLDCEFLYLGDTPTEFAIAVWVYKNIMLCMLQTQIECDIAMQMLQMTTRLVSCPRVLKTVTV